MNTWRRLVAGVAFVALVIAGCGGNKPATAPADSQSGAAPAPAKPPVKQELVVRMYGNGQGLDPVVTTALPDYQVMINIYNGLTRYKPGTSEIEPDLAERWEISNEGKTFTFFLRKGVQFHKGYGEFTAEDVKFSFDRHLDPAVKSVHAASMKDIIDKIEVVDTYTVRFQLKDSFAPFLHHVAMARPMQGAIVSKKAVEAIKDNYKTLPVGTGPFEVTENTPRQQLVMKRFDKYFRGPAKLETITYRYIPDASVALIALEKGEIHLTSVDEPTKELVDRVDKNKDLKLLKQTVPGVYVLNINPRRKPFDNPKVREALRYGIDRQGIINSVLGGFGVVANSEIPPNFFAANPDVPKYSYDLNKAKAMLAEAGFPNGFKVTFHGRADGGSVPWNEPIAESLRQMGLQVDVKILERGAYFAARRDGQSTLSIFSTTVPPDPDFILMQYFHSKNAPPGDNVAYYTGADKFIEQGRRESDLTKRAQIYKDAQMQMYKDFVTVPLSHTMDVQLIRQNVKGYIQDNFKGYWLYSAALE